MSLTRATRRAPSEQDLRELDVLHASYVETLLPVLGPLFGVGVVLFAVWDYLIDPRMASTTLLLRVSGVLVGSLAYLPQARRLPVMLRCAYLYGTHASVIIVCAYLLNNGLLLGLAGVTACAFTVAVAALRLRTFLLILLAPSILFVVLCFASMAPAVLVNSLMLYCFSVCIAAVIQQVIRRWRQQAYLLEKELLHSARHDSLTGACSRGYLTELAERELSLARRYGRPLSVAMLDIDHFKCVNDTYGHACGDLALQHLVEACMGTLRVIDHFGRIGGEEFACILPETGADEALAWAERTRRCVEALRIPASRAPFQFTVSIGVATLSPCHRDWNALLSDADLAMYRAKASGRNRVVLAAANEGSSNNVVPR